MTGVRRAEPFATLIVKVMCYVRAYNLISKIRVRIRN